MSLRLALEPVDASSLIRTSVKVKTAAQRLDMDESIIRRLLDRGELEGHRAGKRGVRVYTDSIENYQRRGAIAHGARAPARKATPPREAGASAAQREALAYLASCGVKLGR